MGAVMKGHRETQAIRGAGPRLRAVGRRLRSGLVVSSLAALGLTLIVGCSDSEEAEFEEPEVIDPASIPTPPADGPPLWGARSDAPILDRPSPDGAEIGTLAFGGRVARSEEPVTTRGCEGGWYAIHPEGFVCAGRDATVDPEAPAAKMLAPPARDANLPFRYAQVKGKGAVTYARLPTAEEQDKNEWKLKKQKPRKEVRLGPTANDVARGEDGYPAIAPVIRPGADGVNEEGYRTNVAWFELPSEVDGEPGFQLMPHEDDLVILKPKTRLAILGAVRSNDRTFAILSTGRFIGMDQLEPELGVPWHGWDAREKGLSMGFALRHTNAYTIEKRVAKKNPEVEFERHQAIPLEGRYRTIHKQRYYQTYEGHWVRHRDMITVLDRGQLPDFATGKRRWIDVSLANQTLTLFEGKKVVYTTLISSGRDRIGDPAEGPSTKQGVFHIRRKAVRQDLDDREAHMKHSVGDAPWFMEFEEGFALVGAYWLSRYGESRLYHHIGLSPVDARFIFRWTKGAIPNGWNSVRLEEEESTIVYVHK